MKRSIATIFASLAFICSPTAKAQGSTSPQAAAQVFAIPQTSISSCPAIHGSKVHRSCASMAFSPCIRGTLYTDKSGLKQDCGTVSLAMLAATIRDTKPTCSPIAQLPPSVPQDGPIILVICSAHVGDKSLDLGTVLITQVFAFAAFSNDAKPIYMPYLATEATAKQAKSGLWAYPDMPHPNLVLFSTMQKQTTKQ